MKSLSFLFLVSLLSATKSAPITCKRIERKDQFSCTINSDTEPLTLIEVQLASGKFHIPLISKRDPFLYPIHVVQVEGDSIYYLPTNSYLSQYHVISRNSDLKTTVLSTPLPIEFYHWEFQKKADFCMSQIAAHRPSLSKRVAFRVPGVPTFFHASLLSPFSHRDKNNLLRSLLQLNPPTSPTLKKRYPFCLSSSTIDELQELGQESIEFMDDFILMDMTFLSQKAPIPHISSGMNTLLESKKSAIITPLNFVPLPLSVMSPLSGPMQSHIEKTGHYPRIFPHKSLGPFYPSETDRNFISLGGDMEVDELNSIIVEEDDTLPVGSEEPEGNTDLGHQPSHYPPFLENSNDSLSDKPPRAFSPDALTERYQAGAAPHLDRHSSSTPSEEVPQFSLKDSISEISNQPHPESSDDPEDSKNHPLLSTPTPSPPLFFVLQNNSPRNVSRLPSSNVLLSFLPKPLFPHVDLSAYPEAQLNSDPLFPMPFLYAPVDAHNLSSSTVYSYTFALQKIGDTVYRFNSTSPPSEPRTYKPFPLPKDPALVGEENYLTTLSSTLSPLTPLPLPVTTLQSITLCIHFHARPNLYCGKLPLQKDSTSPNDFPLLPVEWGIKVQSSRNYLPSQDPNTLLHSQVLSYKTKRVLFESCLPSLLPNQRQKLFQVTSLETNIFWHLLDHWIATLDSVLLHQKTEHLYFKSAVFKQRYVYLLDMRNKMARVVNAAVSKICIGEKWEEAVGEAFQKVYRLVSGLLELKFIDGEVEKEEIDRYEREMLVGGKVEGMFDMRDMRVDFVLVMRIVYEAGEALCAAHINPLLSPPGENYTDCAGFRKEFATWHHQHFKSQKTTFDW